MQHGLIAISPTAQRGDPITKACFAAAAAHVRSADESEVCRELFPRDKVVEAFVTRDPSDLGTGAGWGSPLVGAGVQEFLGSLTPYSAIAAVLDQGIIASLDGAGAISFPRRATDPRAYGLVAEGSPIPVYAAELASVSLTGAKVGGITVIGRSLAKHARGQVAVEKMIREDAGRSLDGAYLSTDAGGLLNGVTPITPDTGEGLEAMRNDIANVAAAAATNGNGNVTIIASPARFAKIRVMLPDIGLIILPSIAVPADRLVGLDASGLVHAFRGVPDIESTEAATLHMDTEPSAIVDASGTVAAPVRSLYQTAAIGIRCVLDVGFAKRTATAAAYVDGIANW